MGAQPLCSHYFSRRFHYLRGSGPLERTGELGARSFSLIPEKTYVNPWLLQYHFSGVCLKTHHPLLVVGAPGLSGYFCFLLFFGEDRPSGKQTVCFFWLINLGSEPPLCLCAIQALLQSSSLPALGSPIDRAPLLSGREKGPARLDVGVPFAGEFLCLYMNGRKGKMPWVQGGCSLGSREVKCP